MKTINYAGGSVLTNNDVADALVEYAAALARHGGSAELSIPVILDDGSRSEASMLLGPASQLVAQPAPEARGEFVDADLVDEIARKTALLGPLRAEPVDSIPAGGLDEYGLE